MSKKNVPPATWRFLIEKPCPYASCSGGCSGCDMTGTVRDSISVEELKMVLGLPPTPKLSTVDHVIMPLPCRVVLDVLETELGPLRRAQILGRALEHKDAANAFPGGARERKDTLHRSIAWLERHGLIRSDEPATGEWRLAR